MRRNLILGWFVLTALAGAATVEDYGSPEWRTEISHGYMPYRKLGFDDFPMTEAGSSHLMNTVGFFHYSYKAVWEQASGRSEATARFTEITVRSGFDRNKSWQRSGAQADSRLLEHEQGHLDINELTADDFRKAPWPTATGATGDIALKILDSKIKALSDKCTADNQAEQNRYDYETNHGADRSAQQRWTQTLQKRLRDRKILYWDQGR